MLVLNGTRMVTFIQNFSDIWFGSQNFAFQNQKIKSKFSLHSLHYAKVSNELTGPNSASLRSGNTAPFEEISQQWRAVGNTVSDLTGPRFEPQTSRSRHERVIARPTGRSVPKSTLSK